MEAKGLCARVQPPVTRGTGARRARFFCGNCGVWGRKLCCGKRTQHYSEVRAATHLDGEFALHFIVARGSRFVPTALVAHLPPKPPKIR